MRKIIFTLLIIHCTLMSANALDTLSIKYFPLRVGDFWVYNCHNWGYGITSYDTVYKIKTSVVTSFVRENHIYYILTSHPICYYQYNNILLRADTITGSLYRYDSLNSCSFYYKEKIVDSLWAKVGDELKNCYNYPYTTCTNIDTISIFGLTKTRMQFDYLYSYGSSSIDIYTYLTFDFGITKYESWFHATGGHSDQYILTLLGCKLNGIVYGDTLTTSVNNIGNEISVHFGLYQNYPNPFNPVTKIKFEFPLSKGGLKGVVSLKVYDILGKEIQTLVNEKLQPGTYEVTFDGINLPSGVYFYKLIAGNYVESKKMILIK